MAYRIDIPATAGYRITAATLNNSVCSVVFEGTSSSQGSGDIFDFAFTVEDGVSFVRITSKKNTGEARDGYVALKTKINGKACKTYLHVYQAAGSSTGYARIALRSTASSMGSITSTYNLYLTNRPIGNASMASSLYSNGTSIGGNGATICQFKYNRSAGACSYNSMSSNTGKVNKFLADGTYSGTENFNADTEYYVCAIEAGNSSHYYSFATRAKFISSSADCSDYVISLPN